MIIKCGKTFKILKLVELGKGYREVICITLLQNNLFGKKILISNTVQPCKSTILQLK